MNGFDLGKVLPADMLLTSLSRSGLAASFILEAARPLRAQASMRERA